jgi:hypothetical protein
VVREEVVGVEIGCQRVVPDQSFDGPVKRRKKKEANGLQLYAAL